MLFPAEIAVSFQPWYRRSLPPRALKAWRSGLTALTIAPTFSSTTFRSRSSSNVRQSQAASLYATWNEPTETPGGWDPPEMTFHPASLPGSLPGNTYCPDLVFAAAYMRFTDSSCGGVRHASVSLPLQSKTDGSKRQARGSFSSPSFTPSLASHASSAAWFSTASFAGLTALDGSFSVGIETPRSQA